MQVKHLTLMGTTFALVTTSTVAVAQSSSDPAQVNLSPDALNLLCKEFPLNSRCNSSTNPSYNSSGTPSPTQQDTNSNDNPLPSTGSPNSPTANPATKPTLPGSTTPPVGPPPGAGSQKRPYVTPQ